MADGYFSDSYWASDYFASGYWGSGGAAAPAPVVPTFISGEPWRTKRREPKPWLSLKVMMLAKEYLEMKLEGGD